MTAFWSFRASNSAASSPVALGHMSHHVLMIGFFLLLLPELHDLLFSYLLLALVDAVACIVVGPRNFAYLGLDQVLAA